MRLSARFTLLLALLLTACGPVAAPTSAPARDAPTAIQTDTVTADASPNAPQSIAQTAPKPLEVSYRGFRLSIDESLATIVRGEAVDALTRASDRLDTPEHVRFTFDDLVPSGDFDPHQPQLLIFPARAYLNLSPSAALQIGALQKMLSERSTPQQGALPMLPFSLNAEALHAQPRFLEFQGGSGVRYIARYNKNTNVSGVEDLFYTFQGLSSDGEYYIAFFYPVSASDLSAIAGDNAGTVAMLNQLAAADFGPNLSGLDELILSLTMPEVDASLRESQPPKAILATLRNQGLPGLRSLWDALQAGPQDIFSTETQLNTDLFDLEVNGSKDEYQIIVISDEIQQNWQYLLFRAVGIRWWFSGRINLPFQAFVPPSYQIQGDGQDVWLVLDWLAQSGAGITRYDEGWFLLSQGQLGQVLEYPVEGYQTLQDGPYNVCYRAKPETSNEDGGFAVRLPFSITYSIYGDGKERTNLTETYDLFDMQRKAVYRWNPEARLFKLDEAQSNLSVTQVDAGFYFSSPGSDLVKFAGNELAALAQEGGTLQKRWLKQYLQGLENSPEIEQILKSMGG